MQRNNIRALILGDIVGPIGRNVVKYYLSNNKKKENIDFVIANGENVTHGHGLSYEHYLQLLSYGIDCITSGNHFFDSHDCFNKDYDFSNYIRPINLDKDAPLIGSKVYTIKDNIKIRVTNALGRVFMNNVQSNPFYDIDNIISNNEKTIHIVDFHAEATAEKRIMGEYLSNRVTAVFGTHTHVQTNDAKLLNDSTFFISDVGMNGQYDSVLGTDKDKSIYHTVKLLPKKFDVNLKGDGLLNGLILDINPDTYKVESFKVLNEVIKQELL